MSQEAIGIGKLAEDFDLRGEEGLPAAGGDKQVVCGKVMILNLSLQVNFKCFE
jgi:hypothetical protein